MSGVRTKRIEIPHTSGSYRPGDTVTVVGQTATGLRATFLAYILPLIFLLAILGASASMGARAEQSAVISLSVLTAYYLGIYFFRNKLKQTFTFTIQSP
jgi:sigma-E factor negative regulatory protein RseC